jgi:hypothetical protein
MSGKKSFGAPSDDDLPTQRIGEQGGPNWNDGPTPRIDTPVPAWNADDGKTRIHRPDSSPPVPTVEDADDPVVGWLVVVSGPGRGRAVKIGHGVNSLGRAATERISLDFGDDEISRTGHALVTYDQRHRKFYIQHGTGTNLSYVGDAPLLAPTELTGGESIHVANTVLRFVALCGPDFDWSTR